MRQPTLVYSVDEHTKGTAFVLTKRPVAAPSQATHRDAYLPDLGCTVRSTSSEFENT